MSYYCIWGFTNVSWNCTDLAEWSKLAPPRASLNTAASLITGSKRNKHITPDLNALNWLPYEARIQLKNACMTHKALHFNTPKYLADKLKLSAGGRSSRSTSTLLLKPQKFRKMKTYNRAFSRLTPRIWSSLPPWSPTEPFNHILQKRSQTASNEQNSTLNPLTHLSGYWFDAVLQPGFALANHVLVSNSGSFWIAAGIVSMYISWLSSFLLTETFVKCSDTLLGSSFRYIKLYK